MKRWLQYLSVIIILTRFCMLPAAASGGDFGQTISDSQSASSQAEAVSSSASSGSSNTATGQPKLMVTNYSLDSGALRAGESGTLSVTVHNTHTQRSIRNLKMIFSVEDNEIVPVNMGTKHLQKIRADGWYQWKFDICALAKATSGVHPVTIIMEYEDSDGTSYTATDILVIEVRQPVKLSYDEPALDTRLTQGDTPTFSMQLRNMGKSTIYNALLTFDLPGLANGGSVLIGEIAPGETQTGTTNFRVGEDVLGKVEGEVTLTYEDDFGKTYTKTIPLTTTIQKKTEIKTPVETEKKFTLSGPKIVIAAVTGGILLVVMILLSTRAIKKKREREEDERRL